MSDSPTTASTKSTGLPAAVRRQRIADLAGEHEFVRVADLSTMFRISEVTVRSDLAHLEQAGAVRRVHGGAVSIEVAPAPEPPFEESLGSNAEAKSSIGDRAAAMVVNGQTIVLDVGTTTTAMARALVQRSDLANITVFTNSLNVALELEVAIPRITVVVTGGTLRSLQHSLVDPLGGLVFDRVRVDTAYLGCNGVDIAGGVTNVNLPEAEMKRRMMNAAKRTVVLADSSKLARVSTARLCALDEVDLLVTDGAIPAELRWELEESGLDIEVTGAAASDLPQEAV